MTIDLPTLGEAPSVISTAINGVNLEWTPWREGVDTGDPPVVGYAVYSRQLSGNWTEIESVDQSVISALVAGLDPDTDYELSVAAVREGTGGTGPRSPSVSATTACGSELVILRRWFIIEYEKLSKLITKLYIHQNFKTI